MNKWEIRIGCWILIISISIMVYSSMKDGGNMMGKIQAIKESVAQYKAETDIRFDKLENAPKWHR